MFGGMMGLMKGAREGQPGARLAKGFMGRLKEKKLKQGDKAPASAGSPGKGFGGGIREMLAQARSSGSKPAAGGFGSLVKQFMEQQKGGSTGAGPGGAPGFGPAGGGLDFLKGRSAAPAMPPMPAPQGNPQGFGPPPMAQVGMDKLAATLPGRLGQMHTSPGAAPANPGDAQKAMISQLLEKIRGGSRGPGMGGLGGLGGR